MLNSSNSLISNRSLQLEEISSEQVQWVKDLVRQPGWELLWALAQEHLYNPAWAKLRSSKDLGELTKAQGSLDMYESILRLINDLGGKSQ